MADDDLDSILAQVHASPADVVDLLQVYQGANYAQLWQQHVRLYQTFAKKLIGSSYPTRAFELAREGLAHHVEDPELMYLCALALARGGSISKATEYVAELLKRPALDLHLKVEALSLVGRLDKDRYARTHRRTLKTRFAQESARWYASAHGLCGDSFPGINAATMFLLAGEPAKARALAATVVPQAQVELAQPGRSEDYWLWATLGEAHLILGDMAEADGWYRKAVQGAGSRLGDIASMRRNVRLLSQQTQVSTTIWDLFNVVGTVVVFSGHMLDHPSRAAQQLSPRFPPDPALEHAVSQAIQQDLESLNATIGYCSAACGSDILFAERMLERGAELHIVLPFAKEDHYYTSVDFGLSGMSRWRERCDRVLAQAKEVHYATTEPFLGDHVLFAFVNSFTQGLALTRAAQLGAEPYALAVLDPTAKKFFGGTAYFLEQWTARGHRAQVIDLASLRAHIHRPLQWLSGSPSPPPPTVIPGPVRRVIKTMLFADVKNFSKLREEQAPAFVAQFLDQGARVIRRLTNPPAFCNTWGDGLYLVFNRVTDAADFAIRLLQHIERINWEKLGLPADTTVRMGLHAGPVYPRMDKVINRKNFFGAHVNRAARIEPVTTPGCAFTSEQFAALLAVEPGHDFVCEYVGVERLAKEFDRCPLYRLGRR